VRTNGSYYDYPGAFSDANPNLRGLPISSVNDKEMFEDEARRAHEIERVIKEKYGGIHPLHGALGGRAKRYDLARMLPMDAYPRTPAHKGVDSDYHHDIAKNGRDYSMVPNTQMTRDIRYLQGKLNQDDLEAIDRRRHTAIKEILRHNGRDTKENCLFPDCKYPLTGPPIELPSGHPQLQPENRLFMPNSPYARDLTKLDEMDQHLQARADQDYAAAVQQQQERTSYLEGLRAQVEQTYAACDPEVPNAVAKANEVAQQVAPPLPAQ